MQGNLREPIFWQPAERQRFAIARSRERREAELAPMLQEIGRSIDLVGWPEARPLVEMVMGYPIPRRRGRWWRGVSKRKAAAMLRELSKLPAQTRWCER